jgi:tRNA(Ile)-lysidine synthase
VTQTDVIRRAVAQVLGRFDSVVLAVSGGLDSMTLLHAAAACLPHQRLVVATFDHGTGAAATSAARLAARRAPELGIETFSRRADRPLETEADFRRARWQFLREVAAEKHAVIATAHTESDQVETILLRVLRDAGARGLAGLYADTGVARPLITFTRGQIAAYASENALDWIEDPTNALPTYARNRVRLELLPVLRRAHPRIERELLDISRRAADWRREMEAFVDRSLSPSAEAFAGLDVPMALLADRSRDELAVLWPTIAARLGVTLDRRGTERLAAFTLSARVGSRVPLAGGWRVVRARDAWQLRASPGERPSPMSLAEDRLVHWGNWRFGPAREPVAGHAMSAWLPMDGVLSVRCWQPGDSMVVHAGSAPRKVKQLLSRAGVTGHERAAWPVVLAGNHIVWIPGVRRGDATTARSGRPGLTFACEHHRS